VRLDVAIGGRVSSVGISTAEYIINNQMKRIINTHKTHTELAYMTYVQRGFERKSETGVGKEDEAPTSDGVQRNHFGENLT
jgi:hypothetical protein